MAKIPFDIKYRPQIESGEYKVETRDGRPARIICWDARADDGACIIALIPGYGGEEAYQFFPDGHAFSSKSSDEDCADLFLITPEPELTDFEKCVKECLEYDPEVVSDGDLLEATKEYAKELLATARKELQPEIDKERVDGYQRGLDAAKIDLPYWKKCSKGELIGRSLFFDSIDGLIIQPLDHRGFAPGVGFFILLDDITKLPKEG